MKEMDYVKKYVDQRITKDTTWDEIGEMVIDARNDYNQQIKDMSDMIKRFAIRKQQEAASTSPWEVEHYYETKLKKYDQEVFNGY